MEGSTAEAVVKAVQEGKLRGIAPVAVISSKPDAAEEFQGRFLPLEHDAVISALARFGSPDIHVASFRRSSPLVPDHFTQVANDAKTLAVQVFPHG